MISFFGSLNMDHLIYLIQFFIIHCEINWLIFGFKGKILLDTHVFQQCKVLLTLIFDLAVWCKSVKEICYSLSWILKILRFSTSSGSGMNWVSPIYLFFLIVKSRACHSDEKDSSEFIFLATNNQINLSGS
jgi:hypothetical protein